MDAGRNFNVPVPTLYKAHIAKARLDDEEASSYLPGYSTAKKIVYNSLKEGRPPMPRNLKDITLDGNWVLTLDNKDFLLINDGDNDKILAFSTLENLKLLCSSDKIFLDGTFKANPRMFKQLYTIHGRYCDQIFPLIFCLLPDKSQATYQRLFTNLKNIAMKKGIKFEVKNAMMDFESASMNAFESVFPQTALKGCFFHYTQCILRKVQTLGLKMMYQNDDNVQRWVRRIMALPLIPTSQIADAFRFLQDESPQNLIQKDKMHQYVMKTWLDPNKPVFNISVWNHFENSSERTNNNVEGFHSMLNKRCQPHPNLFGCIEIIKSIQQENTVIMEMLSAGKIKPVQSLVKYRKINEKIAHLKDNLSQNRILLNAYTDEVGKLLHSED